MVGTATQLLARRQKIIYGVKRGKIPATLRPNVLPERKEMGMPTCLDEMSKLFNCWSSSSYSDNECGKEIKAFLTCANQSIENYYKEGKGKKTEWNIDKINQLLRQHTIIKKREMNEKKVFLNEIILKRN